ncbi:MAG TPA: hypothetical protein PLT12_04490, partial [Kiritimatiellia bacterium]|nr:hypothetical protein [Kiritimatiellia bacterium]HPK69644.1 hypothetical protein [Kiritimatiellia bacterium]
ARETQKNASERWGTVLAKPPRLQRNRMGMADGSRIRWGGAKDSLLGITIRVGKGTEQPSGYKQIA